MNVLNKISAFSLEIFQCPARSTSICSCITDFLNVPVYNCYGVFQRPIYIVLDVLPSIVFKFICSDIKLATGLRAAAQKEPEATVTTCKACGKPIVQRAGIKELKFCSGTCRQSWWNSHPEMVNRKAVYEFTCACCGKPFSAYGNAHRKYCSHACYIEGRYGRRDAR